MVRFGGRNAGTLDLLFALALSSPLLSNPRSLTTNDLDPGMAGQFLPTAPNLNDDCLIHIFDEMSLADLQAWGSTTRANYQKVSSPSSLHPPTDFRWAKT